MIREAVILAAGIGSRLGSLGKGAKFALTVANRPLITYPIFSLASAGAKRFIIVTRSETVKPIERALRGMDHILEYRFCINDEWERENGYSLFAASRCVRDERFFLSMSDHIYPREIPERLRLEARKHPSASIIVAGDREPLFVDVGEATLIEARGGRVVAIGKGLPSWSHVDTGVFVMKREVFTVASHLARRKYRLKLSEIVQAAAYMGLEVRVADVTGIPWTEVDTVDDYMSVVSGIKARLPQLVYESWHAYPSLATGLASVKRI